MLFRQALMEMIEGKKVFLPASTYFKFLYFDKDAQCFKYNFGDVFEINDKVVKDGWEYYKSEPITYSPKYIVYQGLIKEIDNVYQGIKTVNYNLVENGTKVANDSIELLCDERGFSLKTGRNHAFKESSFKNKGYLI